MANVNQNVLGGLTVQQTKEFIELLIWRAPDIVFEGLKPEETPGNLASIIFESLVKKGVTPLTAKDGTAI
jgi:hypothetical protein